MAKFAAVAKGGKTDFQELQNAMKEGRAQRMAYYTFDILYADGYDLTKVPLVDRKHFLESALASGSRSIVYSKHVVGHGPEYFKQACKLGLEGIISKRADRPYYMGRGARLAQGEMRQARGVCHRWIHRPGRQPYRIWLAAVGLLRQAEQANVCRPSRHRL